MSQQTRGQMIPVSNDLRLKVGSFGDIDGGMLAKAEAALQSLAERFDAWMQDDLAKLDAARARITAAGYTAETAENLFLPALDLKGLGGTYGYPVVSQIAASLCRLRLTEPATEVKAPLFLLDAHIDGIKAAVRGNIREADHPVAKSLLDELDQRVKDYEK